MQLRWAGNITRMEDICMPKEVFFSELQEGKHNCDAPKKHYKDKLKRQLALAGITYHVIAAGGLKLRQLMLISEKSHSHVRGREA